jgi:hypothetical protein
MSGLGRNHGRGQKSFDGAADSLHPCSTVGLPTTRHAPVMAYFLDALIFRTTAIDADDLPADGARIVPLSSDLSLLPLTDEVRAAAKRGDEVMPGDDGSSWSLPSKIERWAGRMSQRGDIGYVAAAYFGGSGNQFAVVWSGGQVVLGPLRQPDAINAALRRFGIRASGGQDEFDSLGLGRHRHTEEWV